MLSNGEYNDHMIGCESGRQDSNLRPLVPQISPHFPMSAEFDLEWFCAELVGMTTRAGVMESAGIAEKYSALFGRDLAPSLEPPGFPRRDHTFANVSVKTEAGPVFLIRQRSRLLPV
jgi:hypothetical protein